MFQPPSPRPRPKFAAFLFDRDVDYRAAADSLASSRETIRLVCLPFDDVRRRVPNAKLMARIVAWTQGHVRPSDFYDLESIEVAA